MAQFLLLYKLKEETMILKLFFLFSFAAISSPCYASNALRGKSFTPSMKHSHRKEFKVDSRVVIKEEPLISYEDVAAVMPKSFQKNESGQQVVSQILQNSANVMMKSDIIANSFLMKTAKKVENTTKMDMAIKQKDGTTNNEIEHKFNFDFQALKAQAKLAYSGFVDSKIQYQATNNTLLISLEEKLSKNSKIALSHLKNHQQSQQLLQYQVNW